MNTNVGPRTHHTGALADRSGSTEKPSTVARLFNSVADLPYVQQKTVLTPPPPVQFMSFVGAVQRVESDPTVSGQLVSPNGLPAKEGEIQVGAPPAIQLWGYGGVRKVDGKRVKDMEEEHKSFEERETAASAPGGTPLSAEEQQKKAEYKAIIDDVNKTKDEDYLIFAGHIGVSVDNGATIYGFTPVAPEGMPKEAVIQALHNHTLAFPGAVKDDKPHFDLAAQCAATKKWDTDVVTVTRPVSTDAHADTLQRLQLLAGMQPGAHGIYYSFPLADAQDGKWFVDTPGPDGKIIKGEAMANCATFPGKIGIELPENSGNLRFFMPALRAEAAASAAQ